MLDPRLAFGLLALSAALHAQAQELRSSNHTSGLDSGYLQGSGSGEQRLPVGTVAFAQAPWLRLHFSDQTNLPEGCRIEITSQRDGAVQRFDAISLLEYRHCSAFFNGDRVDVALVLASGARQARVRVASADVGEVEGPVVAPATICGPTDDRALSSDPRQGRQSPAGCTSWLVNEFTVLTAGHCTATAAQQVHFNVPLSTSSGGLVFPPPQDQYAYDTATLQRLDGGVGNDWTVTTTVRNSNTRMYPGQKQGAWYELGSIPASPTGQNIRITGYGTVSSPVSATWKQVQKTHVGPMVAQSASYPNGIGYTTDSTGGNSGSPVIHENTGKAVGIHTHGGCSSTSGNNWGTRVDRQDLQAAVASRKLLKSVGKWATLGTSCAGSAGTGSLLGSGYPDLGFTPKLNISGVLPGQNGLVLLGRSKTSWSGYALPLDLGPLGSPGCMLVASAEVALPLPTGTGTPTLQLSIPVNTALRGAKLYCQYASADPAANALGLVTTNGLEGTVGD